VNQSERPSSNDAEFHLSGSVLVATARIVMAATLWLVRRPFLMSRARWLGLLGVLIGLDVAMWILAPALAGGGVALLVLVIGAVLAHWWWLGRGSDPIIFISLFEGRSSLGRDVAATHIGALKRFLEEDANLEGIGPFAIRVITIPLSGRQAERLLRISGALAVVRGSGDAVGDSTRWEWYACFRDSRPDVMITKYEFSILNNNAARPLRQRLVAVAPALAEAHDIEGGLNLSSFVATDFAVGHFKAVAKTICVLGSEKVFERALEEQPEEPYRLLLPDPSDPDLAGSLQGRVAIMEAQTEIGQGRDHLEVLEGLQELVRSGAGDSGFGIWLQAQWYAATVEHRVEKAIARQAGEEILSLFPDSVGVMSNAAGLSIQMEDLARGEELLDRMEGLDPAEASIPRLRANIAWTRRDPGTALAYYKQSNPRQYWQMGDCYAALGELDRALRLYRKMLRRDASARHALDHARAIRRIPRLLPAMPGGWREWIWGLIHSRPRLAGPLLRVWRFAIPEDPWLRTWLARHALVVDQIEVARRWVILATRIEYTNRLIATMDALVVGAIREEGDLPANFEHLAKHIYWLEAQGETMIRLEGEAALFALASVRYDLFVGEHGDEIEGMFAALGFETPGQLFRDAEHTDPELPTDLGGHECEPSDSPDRR
jgi:tetratricopeptide (TPR) repeat protein